MVLGKISQCKKRLNFCLRPAWPKSLPAVAFGDVLISHFGGDSDQVLIYSENFSGLFFDLYKSLTFAELASLRQSLASVSEINPSFFDEAAEHYGFRLNEDHFKILSILQKLDRELLLWLHDLQFSARDLWPLRRLEKFSGFSGVVEIIERLSKLRANRNQSSQILELFTDLTEACHPQSEILVDSTQTEKWLTHLKALRYPVTRQSDLNRKKTLGGIALPSKVRIDLSRVGDEAGLKIEIFASNSSDLERRLESVKDLNEKLGNEFWNH